MFDDIFFPPNARKYRAAPLAEQRELYLVHLKTTGATRSTLRKCANDQLNLVRLLDLTDGDRVSRFYPGRPMSAWLARIAINKCRDWGRRRAVRRLFGLHTPVEDIADLHADDRPLQDTELVDRAELTRLSRAIAELPASQREPLVLCSIEGLSQAEAAGILSISEKAVETRIRRARVRLAELLD